MKILLISGHGAGDSGAVGNGYKEADLTREMANLIAPKLRKFATVDIYDQSRNAFKDVKAGKFNIGKYDYILELHLNASKKDSGDGKVKGTEIYVTTREKGISVEQSIMKRVSKYFPLRDNDSVFDGVKRENFAVINKCKNLGMSAALWEMCFIDDADDMKIFIANKDGIAQAATDGIVSAFGLKTVPTPKTTTKTTTTSTKTSTNNLYLSCKGIYSGGSIVEALNKIGVSSSFSNRSKLAKANGIKLYAGTVSQNTKLLNLLKEGKLRKA